jgi:hypothetical protein
MAGLSYRGAFTADVCLQWNNGTVVRHNVSFGKMPIMVKVCMYYVFVMGKMFPLSTRDLLFNSVGYTQVVAQISSVSADITDFSTSNMFLLCVSSFTVQCVPFTGFG